MMVCGGVVVVGYSVSIWLDPIAKNGHLFSFVFIALGVKLGLRPRGPSSPERAAYFGVLLCF